MQNLKRERERERKKQEQRNNAIIETDDDR